MSLALTRGYKQSLVFFTPSNEQFVIEVRSVNKSEVRLKLLLPATFTVNKSDSSQVGPRIATVGNRRSSGLLEVRIDAVSGDEFIAQNTFQSTMKIVIDRVKERKVIFRLFLPADCTVWRDELLTNHEGVYSLPGLENESKLKEDPSSGKGPRIKVKKSRRIRRDS